MSQTELTLKPRLSAGASPHKLLPKPLAEPQTGSSEIPIPVFFKDLERKLNAELEKKLRDINRNYEGKQSGPGKSAVVASGNGTRSIRERVLELHGQGKSNLCIAEQLGIGNKSVKNYLYRDEPTRMKLARDLGVSVPAVMILLRLIGLKLTESEALTAKALKASFKKWIIKHPEEAYYMAQESQCRRELRELAMREGFAEKNLCDYGLDRYSARTIVHLSKNPQAGLKELEELFGKYPEMQEREEYILKMAREAGIRQIAKIPFQIEMFAKRMIQLEAA